jgi:two-component system, response regulator YesN
VNILIVEDNAHMRIRLAGVVRAVIGPHPVLLAPDGQRALILCRIARPGLILLDIRLPDADGIELLAEIQVLSPEAIVVIVSNNDSPWSRDSAHRAGAADYVLKDEVYAKLPDVLRRVLGQDDSASP